MYEWVDNVAPNNDDVGGALVLKVGFTDATCADTLVDDSACAIENGSASVNPPWDAPDKSGGDLDPHEFFEGGVNLSALELDGCFSTAVANSRSSQEPGSTLHDFARMQFETCGNLTVHKYIDVDLSGTKNTGDVNTGAVVQTYAFSVVRNSDNTTVCSGSTDVSGNLVCTTGTLRNLSPGSYTITETQKSGFFSSDPGEDNNPATPPNFASGTVSKTVTLGIGDTTVEFGNTCYVDKKFRITNVPTGTAAPSSVTVGWSRDRDGMTSTGTQALTVTATSSIWEGTVNDSFIQTDAISWEWWINGDTDNKQTGGSDLDLDAGKYPTCSATNTDEFQLATLNGLKFKDINANGSQDTGELGLGGFMFTLSQATTVIGTTTSATDGSYSFSNVPPGTYTVSETVLTGWRQTAPAAPGTATVVVVLGDTSKTIAKFGNTPLSNITVTFNPLTTYTRATAISCVDGANVSVGSNADLNSLTTNNVTPGQTDVVCTIKFIDP